MKLDPQKTAVLSLDVQDGLLGFHPEASSIFPNASLVMEAARKGGFPIIHVGLGFEPGYPEIISTNQRFESLKKNGTFLKGSETAKIHSSVFKPGDTVIYKHRVGAFAGNALQMIFHSRGIENLVFFGISTSGIVLSTLRAAYDLDYQCTVIQDACFDPDPEVHRVLTEKVFVRQAAVMTAKEFQSDAAGI